MNEDELIEKMARAIDPEADCEADRFLASEQARAILSLLQGAEAMSDDIARLRALEAALRAYQQADQDGVMVLVSRQACDEAADALPSLLARIEALTVERDQWQSRAQTAWDQMDADMRGSAVSIAIATLKPEVPMSDAIQQERDRLARILEAEALKRSPLTDNGVTQRVTYAIAARIVRRGRALTDREKLENLMRGLEDIEDDEAPTK